MINIKAGRERRRFPACFLGKMLKKSIIFM
jgi:hypothetical protein